MYEPRDIHALSRADSNRSTVMFESGQLLFFFVFFFRQYPGERIRSLDAIDRSLRENITQNPVTKRIFCLQFTYKLKTALFFKSENKLIEYWFPHDEYLISETFYKVNVSRSAWTFYI